MRVAYQGVAGAYSEAALHALLGSSVHAVACVSFEDAFAAVANGAAERALVPIENSLGGSIHVNYDLLLRYHLIIIAEIDFRVRHTLMAVRGSRLQDLTLVRSHPQALAQCDEFLRQHDLQCQPSYDTAGSAQMIAESGEKNVAAIASALAAQTYGLEILAENIEDSDNNYTRFLLLSAHEEVPPLHSPCKTSLVFALEQNVPGALFKALSVFALRDIDLSKIESRPAKGTLSRSRSHSSSSSFNSSDSPLRYKYLFYLDLASHAQEERTVNALRHLSEIFSFIRVLGTYPKHSDSPIAVSDSADNADAPSRLSVAAPAVRATSSNSLTIGIVGFGNFGQFIARRFVQMGHVVVASSRSNYTGMAASIGVEFYESCHEMLSAPLDVIIFAVSIFSFEESLLEFPFHLVQGNILIVDVLSVKTHAKHKMLQIVPERLDVLCTHPMFGPESGAMLWTDLPFVFERVRVRDLSRCQQFIQIWASQGCRLVEMPCEAHDAYAAGSQFLTHFTGRVLERIGPASTPINTKGFERLLELVQNTSKDSLDLFSALYKFNVLSKVQMDAFAAAVKDVRKQLLDSANHHRRCSSQSRDALRLNTFVNDVEESGTSATTDRATSLIREGVDIVKLSVGQPHWPTPEPIRKAASASFSEGHTHYAPVPGLYELRVAIAEKLNTDNGLDYTPNQVVVSNGAKQSIFQTFQVLLRPGDEVILLCPCWPSYAQMARLCGAKAVFLEVLTAAAMEEKITTHTRLLVMCFPNNPSGLIFSHEELISFAKVLLRYPNIWVLSDEIYELISFVAEPHVSFATLPQMFDRTITVNGFSKAFAMTGYRIGYLACGNHSFIRACIKVQSHTTSAANTIAQYAALAALEMDKSFLLPILDELREHRDLVVSMLNGVRGVTMAIPHGAFYVFLDITSLLPSTAIDGTEINSDIDLVDLLLDQYHVAVVAGSIFHSPGFLRICYSVEKDRLKLGLDRIVACFHDLTPASAKPRIV